jgi:uncharacterized protein YecE (DUF72 family)
MYNVLTIVKHEILIGTSGWMYNHWNRTFYAEAGKEDQLAFYAKEFKTVEINYTFYRIPDADNYLKWYDRTPPDFRFTIKLNRFITHLKWIIIDKESKQTLQTFMNDTQGLKEKLAVILIQLQPKQGLNIDRLNIFLSEYTSVIKYLNYKPRTCIEFRNTTWFNNETYKLLEKYDVALVFPSTPEYRHVIFTSDFAFIRQHGGSSYSDQELNNLANEIQGYPSKIKHVYVYFNNDINTYAIYNARYLMTVV